jgi:uncharacterized protein (DUF433 family)
MIVLPETITLPMKMDDGGLIRVSGRRVTLDSILACYHKGYTPEQIHESFDVVPLEDVYAVIGYYLSHREEVDAYLKANQEEGERIRAEIEASYTPEQWAKIERLRTLAAQKRLERESTL